MKAMKLLLCFSLLGPVAGATVKTTIFDGAELLSKPATTALKTMMDRLLLDTGAQVVVETMRGKDSARVSESERQKQDARFQALARDRAAKVPGKGILILVHVAPEYLVVIVGEELNRTGLFKTENRGNLLTILSEFFAAKNFEGGLLKGMDYIRRVITKDPSVVTAPKANQAASSDLLWWFFSGLLFVATALIAWPYLKPLLAPVKTPTKQEA